MDINHQWQRRLNFSFGIIEVQRQTGIFAIAVPNIGEDRSEAVDKQRFVTKRRNSEPGKNGNTYQQNGDYNTEQFFMFHSPFLSHMSTITSFEILPVDQACPFRMLF